MLSLKKNIPTSELLIFFLKGKSLQIPRNNFFFWHVYLAGLHGFLENSQLRFLPKKNIFRTVLKSTFAQKKARRQYYYTLIPYICKLKFWNIFQKFFLFTWLISFVSTLFSFVSTIIVYCKQKCF